MTEEVQAAPSLAQNKISFFGGVIILIAVVNIGFFVLADIGAEHVNPYVGIMAYVIAPGVLVFGIAIFIAGMLLERRRRRRHTPDEVPQYPDINLNNPRTRRAFLWT